MKPLPAQNFPDLAPTESEIPQLPAGLAAVMPAYSATNRRAATSPPQRAYSWLLAASTGLAGVFCWMYITKPVIRTTAEIPVETRSEEISSAEEAANPAPKNASLLPASDRLPGESSPLAARPAPLANPFEQTNIRVQHILTAEAPGGQLAKIDIDVPVLYQSRSLRWTPAEVADGAWNELVERSIPAAQLRADSPTLSANQQGVADTPRPALLDTAGSIQIKTAGK